MRYVNDVSIPDNTQMAPGQSFTKTWRVRNAGSCAWEAGFKFAFVGGEQMSGATYTLPAAVPVNTEIDISVAMVAPSKAGTLRGNWRMQRRPDNSSAMKFLWSDRRRRGYIDTHKRCANGNAHSYKPVISLDTKCYNKFVERSYP